MLKALVFALWKKVKNLICDVDELNDKFDTHTSNPSAHHTRYSDDEAVNAVDASDKFVERSIENTVTGTTTLVWDAFTLEPIFVLKNTFSGYLAFCEPMNVHIKSKDKTYQEMKVWSSFPRFDVEGTDTKKTIGLFWFQKDDGKLQSLLTIKVLDNAGNNKSVLTLHHDKIECHNLPIRDIKNHDDATLSGTPKILEFNIGGTPYYVKAYPTKS